eukprot:42391-Pleurochrysis_carterae.AAC.1
MNQQWRLGPQILQSGQGNGGYASLAFGLAACWTADGGHERCPYRVRNEEAFLRHVCLVGTEAASTIRMRRASESWAHGMHSTWLSSSTAGAHRGPRVLMHFEVVSRHVGSSTSSLQRPTPMRAGASPRI